MSGETRYLNRSQFASEQGWSPSYVTKLDKQGRLVLHPAGKLVDVEATLLRLRATSDPGRAAVREHHGAARVAKHVTAQVKSDAPAEPAASAAADPKYWGNKARREGALAELAELELAKKRGDLVERAHVESMAYAAGRTLRDVVLGLPAQLAPLFASMSDMRDIEIKLRDALRQVFADAAKMTADDMVRTSEQATH